MYSSGKFILLYIFNLVKNVFSGSPVEIIYGLLYSFFEFVKLKEKLSQVITKDTFDKEILLKDQLKNKSGQYVNKNNISNFTQEKVKKQSLKIKKIKSKDKEKIT